MLNDWFYSHTTWEVALAVCAVVTLIPMAGLFFFHRLVDWRAREEDTSMVGLSYALCGGIYAVVLAFVAVSVYQSMDKGDVIASAEANELSSLTFVSAGLPTEIAVHIRGDINHYIDIVTKKEWPAQQAFHMEEHSFEEGWAQIRKVSLEIDDFEPATPGQATIKTRMMHSINQLFSDRQTRILAAKTHLPDAVWQMLVLGLVLVVFYVYLFGPHSFKLHLAVTGLTMISVGLVFTLIIALDFPFRGELSIDDDAYKGVKELGEHIFASAETAPAGGMHEEKN